MGSVQTTDSSAEVSQTGMGPGDKVVLGSWIQWRRLSNAWSLCFCRHSVTVTDPMFLEREETSLREYLPESYGDLSQILTLQGFLHFWIVGFCE